MASLQLIWDSLIQTNFGNHPMQSWTQRVDAQGLFATPCHTGIVNHSTVVGVVADFLERHLAH